MTAGLFAALSVSHAAPALCIAQRFFLALFILDMFLNFFSFAAR